MHILLKGRKMFNNFNENLQVLHEVDADRNTRFNDAKCDPHGRLWAGIANNQPCISTCNITNIICI